MPMVCPVRATILTQIHMLCHADFRQQNKLRGAGLPARRRALCDHFLSSFSEYGLHTSDDPKKMHCYMYNQSALIEVFCALLRALELSNAAKHLPGIVDALEGLGGCCLEDCKHRCVRS